MPEATVKSIALRWQKHSFSLAWWPHPGLHQDLLLRNSSLWMMCTSWCLDPCSLSSEHITWSWRTGIVSPAPLRSLSWSFSCHTAAGEPSQKVEDRNWPIVDLGQFRLRQSSGSQEACTSMTTLNRKWQQSRGHCDNATCYIPFHDLIG